MLFELFFYIFIYSIIFFFLYAYFHIQSPKKLLYTTLLNIIISFLLSVYGANDYFILAMILFTYSFYIFFEFKTITFYQFSILIGLVGLFYFSSSFSSFLMTYLFNISNTDSIPLQLFMLITYSLFSLLFYLIVQTKRKTSYLTEWLFFILMILFMLVEVMTAIVMSCFQIELLYALLIEIIILFTCGLILYYKVQKQSHSNIALTKQLVKKEYQSKMYGFVEHMVNQISSDKHMMLYQLMNIDHLLSSQNYKEAKFYTKQEIHKFLHYQYISSTGYIFFDYQFTKTINELINHGIDVKPSISLQNNNKLLEDDVIVHTIIETIETIHFKENNIQKVDFFISDFQQYIIFKMIISKSPNLDLSHLSKNEHIKKIHINEQVQYIEVSLLIV